MVNLAIKLPIQLITYSVLVITILFPVASFAGTDVELFRAAISEKVDRSENEEHFDTIKEKDKKISVLNESLTNLSELASQEILKNKKQIKELEDKNLKLLQEINNSKEQNSNENHDAQKPKAASNQHKEINDSYILRFRQFHQETRCYGSTLNFTVGEDKPECVPKEELATRFLGFLIELNLYDKEKLKTKEIAKKELIKLQQKYKFSKLGWYGIHVFNILATELRTKALSTQL